MALPDTDFDQTEMRRDDFGRMPVLQLEDLTPVDNSLPVKLSMIIAFSSWRREQLARSLETIARQTFREFEVLICDMDSGQDMESVYEKFRPYIRMETRFLPRTGWSSCPTKGIKAMLPLAKGEVIAIMQPEMMLNPEAFWYLYHGNYGIVPFDFRWRHATKPDDTTINAVPCQLNIGEGEGETFVNLRNCFISNDETHHLDEVNWHADIHNIENMKDFWTHTDCLSAYTNREHWDKEEHKKWIWWFIGSAKRTATIWDDLPSLDGHGGIDIFLMGYKQIMGYTEIVPQTVLAYHQEHTRASIAPERDEWVWKGEELRKYLKERGRDV